MKFRRTLSVLSAFVMAISTFSFLPEGTLKAIAKDKPVEVVSINESTFPDAKFRAYVLAEFDTDKDKKLDTEEIIYARTVYCVNEGIESLQGIEYLTELRGLYCMKNKIETMDLSHNKLLQGVWCSENLFTDLDFTPNPELLWVYCSDCRLKTFNVKNNDKMAYIEINTNPELEELDVRNNPELEHLTCGNCKLGKLNVKNNTKLTHLDAFGNDLKTLNLSCNNKLKRLDIWTNPELGDVKIDHLKDLQYYNCGLTGISKLDVTHNPELVSLICNYNDIEELDLSKNPKLAVLKAEDNLLKGIDLKYNPNIRLVYLAVGNYGITDLNIGDNPFLMKCYETGGPTDDEWWGKGWKLDYGGLDSTGDDHVFYIWVNEDVTVNTTPSGNAPVIVAPDQDEGVVNNGDLLTREQFVLTLYKMAGSPKVSGTTRFTDVVPGSDYEKAVIWGEQNTICIGYPVITDDTFGVGKYISRQDAVLMLMRYTEYKKTYKRDIDFGRSDEYIDYREIDFDHWEAICWSATWHIMEGKGTPGSPKNEQYIDPYGKATLKELREMISNLYEVNGVTGDIPLPKLKGDVNTDGSVSLLDVVFLSRAVSGVDSFKKYLVEDNSFNVDKDITRLDVVLLSRRVSKGTWD